MSHTHADHNHTPSVTHDNERKVLLSFALIFGFMVVEVVGGLLSGSLALLADAGHMLTDAAALALAYVAFRVGQRAADSKRTFGYARFEVVASLANALALFAIAGWIVVEAWDRVQQPTQVLAGPMLAVAVAGLLVNVLVFWILTRGDRNHVNIKGAALHVVGDLLGSVAAVGAAVVIAWTGWTPIDPILSVLVSLLVLRSAWVLAKQAVHILLEGAPDTATSERIEEHLLAHVPGIASVHHIHVWSLTSGRVLATLHVRPKDDTDVSLVVQAANHALATHFGIEHATVAVDWSTDTHRCSLSHPPKQRAHQHAHAHTH